MRDALARLPPLPDGLRIYAVGDIHGRFDLLQEIASQIRRDLEQDQPQQSVEIFVGDYVDRGPQSRGVIEWMIDTPPITNQRVCLLGNHEEMMLRALDDRSVMANWLFNGGGETLLSYDVKARGLGGEAGLIELQQGFRARLPRKHLEFLAALPRSMVRAPYFFAHAGIRPERPLDEQDPEDLIWIREPFLHSDEDFGCIVVHGHTPVMSPDVRRNRINIDTGAVFTGYLTCIVLEGAEQRFLQAVAT
jgi:serine/threonine protein phosphatase 1